MLPETAALDNRSARRWEIAATLLWSLVLLAVCVHAIGSPHRNSVYPIFAEAGRDWLAGGELYEEDLEPFRYSPLVAAWFVPFGLLPDYLGGLAWRLLNAVVLLGGLSWWTRALLPDTLTRWQRAILFLLVLPLAAGNLYNGQSNALILGLLLLAVAAVARQRWNAAAIALAVACLFKLYPIAVGLLLASVHPRRFGPRLALALGVGLALPFLLQDPRYVADQYVQWMHHLGGDDRLNLLTPDLWYRDLRSLLAAWGLPMSEHVWLAMQLIAAGLCAVGCMQAARMGWPQRRLLRMLLSLGCFWMTLFGPATEAATYLLLAPTAAWALLDAWIERRDRVVGLLVLAAQSLLLASLIAVWFPFGRQVQVLGPRQAAAVLLLVAFLRVELPLLVNRTRPASALPAATSPGSRC